MDAPRVIVLISADAEWEAVRQFCPDASRELSPFGEWFETPLAVGQGEVPVVFVQGGWGKIAAAASTQYVIDRWQPGLLVNLGTCGGIAGRVSRGEVILAEQTLVYDIVEQMGDYDDHIAHYTTAMDLSWLGEELPQTVRRSLIVSADRDLLPEDIPTLIQRFDARVVDWESGAIAWVAQRSQVRCLILRAVTDLVSEAGGEVYGDIELYRQSAREKMAALLVALPDWIRLGLPL